MLAAVMADRTDSFQLVSIAEATRILGVSDSTVRRLLRAGRLEAERVERPQGHVWLVRVPAPVTDPPGTSSKQLGATAATSSESAPALAAWMTSVLEPLMTELGTSRQRIEALARENGRLTAELEALRASQRPQEARGTAEAPEPSTEPSAPLWRQAWLWLLVLAAILLPEGRDREN